MLRESNVVFVGAGNMAEAIVRGLLRAGLPPERLCVTDVRPERLDALQAACGVRPSADNASAVAAADPAAPSSWLLSAARAGMPWLSRPRSAGPASVPTARMAFSPFSPAAASAWSALSKSRVLIPRLL